VFFDYFVRVIKQASLNRAICRRLTESSGTGFKADAGDDFRVAFAVLLERAQAAGAVRADIDVTTCARSSSAASRRAVLARSRHLVRVVVDGLRTR